MSMVCNVPSIPFNQSVTHSLPSFGILKKIKPLLVYLLMPRVEARGHQSLTTPKENVKSLFSQKCFIDEKIEHSIEKENNNTFDIKNLDAFIEKKINQLKDLDVRKDLMHEWRESKSKNNLDAHLFISERILSIKNRDLNFTKKAIENITHTLINKLEYSMALKYFVQHARKNINFEEILKSSIDQCKPFLLEQKYTNHEIHNSKLIAVLAREELTEIVVNESDCQQENLMEIKFLLHRSNELFRGFDISIQNENWLFSPPGTKIYSPSRKKICKNLLINALKQQNPHKEFLVFLKDFNKSIQNSIDCLEGKAPPSSATPPSSEDALNILLVCMVFGVMAYTFMQVDMDALIVVIDDWLSRPENLLFGEVSHEKFLSYLENSRPIIESINELISNNINSSNSKTEWKEIEEKFSDPLLCFVMLYAVKIIKLNSGNQPIFEDGVEQFDVYDMTLLLKWQYENLKDNPIKKFTDYTYQIRKYSDLQPLPDRSLPALVEKLYPGHGFSEGLKKLVPSATEEQIHAVSVLCTLEYIH